MRIPPDMPSQAYGAFEPEGLLAWINADSQARISEHVGVVSHEFSHYVQTMSSLAGTTDLLTLIFGLHSRVQYLEELCDDIRFPLEDWARMPDCPVAVRRLISFVQARQRQIENSYARNIDHGPLTAARSMPTYFRNGRGHVTLRTTDGSSIGVPLGRLSLGEGMATAAKCQTLGTTEDIEEKTVGKKWHYVAAYEACKAANPGVDSILATKCLCDISLCSPKPDETFMKGLRILSRIGDTAFNERFEEAMARLYDQECRSSMTGKQEEAHRAFSSLPENHTARNASWAYVTLTHMLRALKNRDVQPLSLARPVYSGRALYELADRIGSPVVLTNDMRLGLLYSEPSVRVHQAMFSVRCISRLCYWAIKQGGSLICPYAGCPGCPEERRSENCRVDARRVIALADDVPWCVLSFAANQLRIRRLIR